MNFTITQGDNRDVLKTYPDNYFDSVITDPPYGIDFLGKNWDANTGALETYQECLRVLKPGGYLLAFSAARTYHHMAITVEQAGFEIRDQLMWIYASGFPKAQDIGKAIQRRQGVEEFEEIDMSKESSRPMGFSVAGKNGQMDAGLSGKKVIPTSPEAKQWSGWKTALKPAHEPIVMARKPFKGSTIDNVLEHGVGALNIDATRIPTDKLPPAQKNGGTNVDGFDLFNNKKDTDYEPNDQGRFPSNVMGEIEGYQKFFYCPKVSRKERHCGFEAPPAVKFNNPEDMKKHPLWDPSIGTNTHRFMKKLREMEGTLDHIPAPFGDVKGAYVDGERMAKVADDTGFANAGNNHPTVKPVALMEYLIKLVTPPNSKVLDPFTGSGSTGMAAVALGHEFHGMDLDPNYVEIAKTRIEAWNKPEDLGLDPELFE